MFSGNCLRSQERTPTTTQSTELRKVRNRNIEGQALQQLLLISVYLLKLYSDVPAGPFKFFFVVFVFISFPLGKAGVAAGYSTWDPRKQQGDHPYQEIPYGDGPGPRGPIPEVPQTYAQVPPVPQRQGWFLFSFYFVL